MRIGLGAVTVLSTALLFSASEAWALITVGAAEKPWNYAIDVEVAGDLAYLAALGSGLRVIDVSDPTLPVETGAIKLGNPETPGFADDVEVVGNLAYVADAYSGLRVIDFGPEYRATIAAEIDIRPWSESNPINPLGRGLIPVAILQSDTFDVAEVDATTLAFGPDAATPVFDPTNPSVFLVRHRDVNGDGNEDLLSYYPTQETGIAMGDTEACLSGEMQDGTPFEGCDVITTLPPCGNGFEAALVLPPVLWIGGRLRRQRRRPR